MHLENCDQRGSNFGTDCGRDFMSTSAATVSLTLGEIGELARCALARNGCDEENTGALVRTVIAAEHDGAARPKVSPGRGINSA